MRNYFTFSGKDSRDFKAYINGHKTFDSPERNYDIYEVKGRHGSIVKDRKNLKNRELTYVTFIFEDFDKNFSELKNFLLSRSGYQRLQDSYHPDEYRMALFKNAIEPDMDQRNEVGMFELVFDCRPQRFLLSGEDTDIITPMEPISGELLELFNDGSFALSSISGTSGAKLYHSGKNLIGGSLLKDAMVAQGGVSQNAGTANARVMFERDYTGLELPLKYKENTQYTLIFKISWDAKKVSDGSTYFTRYTPITIYYTDGSITKFTEPPEAIPSGAGKEDLVVTTSANKTVSKILIADQNTSTAFTAKYYFYYNSCGVFEGELQLSDFESYIGETKTFPISDNIDLYPGKNILWADSGDIMVQLARDYTIHNPTYFESAPLIRVYGTGILKIGEYTITITEAIGYTDIDCDIMDCFKGSQNRNNYVQFSNYKFPTLKPGDNNVVLGNGISKVEITPRWFIV